MLKTLKKLKTQKKIHPPEWLLGNTVYLCQMGSVAYGISTDQSDKDIYGFAIPTKEFIFPHKFNYIYGFDEPKNFEQWQEHHIKDNDSEYDFTIFSIIKYFKLMVNCNPNMINSLFVPRNCVLHSTQISELVRENRHLFLHKGAWHRFKGYSYNQISKMKNKNPVEGSKRAELVKNFTYDVKYAAHAVRLLLEIEQIMTEETLVLNQDGRRQQLKAIRNGEWTYEEVIKYVTDKEKQLEEVYLKCKLPYSHEENMPKIKEILLTCLEMWYEDTRELITNEKDKEKQALIDIKKIIDGVVLC